MTGQWDEALIREILWPIDAARILQIPLNLSAFNDLIAWHPSETGIFSVKSAYQVEWNHKFRTSLLQPSTSVINPVWKSLWELSIPPKVHIFCWRSLHGIVPLKSILANRHIGSNGQCPICKQGAEDIKHLLFSCGMAMQLWIKLGIYDLITVGFRTARNTDPWTRCKHAWNIICWDSVK